MTSKFESCRVASHHISFRGCQNKFLRFLGPVGKRRFEIFCKNGFWVQISFHIIFFSFHGCVFQQFLKSFVSHHVVNLMWPKKLIEIFVGK
jgi:hypothetical protein